MYILGISCFYHDSAACLLSDGKIVAACQEERFTREKHDWHFPINSIDYCLEKSGITVKELDHVVFYEKPFLKFERILETFFTVAPRGYRAFIQVIPSWVRQKLWLRYILEKEIGYSGKLLYSEHHLAHASSAYFTSSFEEAAVLTVDGVGEWTTVSYGHAKMNEIMLTHEIRFPHSLGLLYSTITSYLGFKVNNDEYKIMGMAPYGEPEYYNVFMRELITLLPDGSFCLNMRNFAFQYGEMMYDTKRFERLFGFPPRDPRSDPDTKHYNLASSLQKVIETVMLALANRVYRETGMKKLCLAGGVALNSVANGQLMQNGPFDDIHIQPAASDAGGALGAAYAVYHHYCGKTERHTLDNLYFGPSYNDLQIFESIEKAGLSATHNQDDALIQQVASLLAGKKVVGWFQGGMEFGPRALGNRSILADPRDRSTRDRINEKVKFREGFRPFAPIVTEEDAPSYFELPRSSPYMLVTVPVRSSRIPAVTHVDNSARVQTLERSQNPRLYDLIKRFEELTGIPVLLNTSLNIRGEPIALTPDDALKCFRHSGMDALVLGSYLLIK